MSNEVTLKELLISKIDSLDQKIDYNHEHLNHKIDEFNQHENEISKNILQQTLKTNGRVTKLEEKVEVLQTADIRHSINCPRLLEIKKLDDKINQIDDSLLEFKMIKKNPKLFIAILAFSIIVFIGSIVYSLYEIHILVNDVQSDMIKKEQTK